MQLKRDTDYAVRILYCLNQTEDTAVSTAAKGLSLSEIAMRTGMPKVVAGRVCESLKDKGVVSLTSDPEAVEKVYCSSKDLLNYSLLDVIEAVEGNCQLFAVFDKRSIGYKNCEEQLQKVQKRTERVLAKATLSSLFDTQNKR